MSYVWASNFSIFGGLLYVPKTGFEWNTREQDLGSIWHSGHTYLPCVLKRCAKPQRLHEGEARLPQQPEDLRLALPGRRRFVLRISVVVELGMENGKLDSEKMTCLSEILATSTWCCMAAAATHLPPAASARNPFRCFDCAFHGNHKQPVVEPPGEFYWRMSLLPQPLQFQQQFPHELHPDQPGLTGCPTINSFLMQWAPACTS